MTQKETGLPNKTTGQSYTAAEFTTLKTTVDDNAVDAESRLLTNRVVVKKASDFGIIDSSKEYYIDAKLDMSTTSIEVPSGGITIRGSSFDISGLSSSEDSYSMFTSPAGGSGNILLFDIELEVTGISSQIFNVVSDTGDEAIEMNRVNFNDCTSLGSVENYRQILESGNGRFGGTPEIELKGAMTGYRIDTSIVRDLSNITSLFKKGAGLVFSGRFNVSLNLDLPTLGAFFDFDETSFSNDESLDINSSRVTRNGVIDASDTTIHPNIDEENVKSFWQDNVGMPNTNKYIRSNITFEIETTISTPGTYEVLDGTWTVQKDSHFDMPANGEFELLSGNGSYQMVGDLVIDGGSNDQLEVRVTKSTDNGASWPTELFSIRRQVNSLLGARDVAIFPINFIDTLVKGDRVRLEVRNNSDTTNVTVELDSYFIITQT